MPSLLYTTQYSQVALFTTAATLWQYIQAYPLIIFSGEMGVGKTTLIRALCTHMGVQDRVISPTFSLVNTYTFVQQGKNYELFHMDWFRVHHIVEIYDMDFTYYVNRQHSYCFIEWGDRFIELFSSPFLLLHMEGEGEERVLYLKVY